MCGRFTNRLTWREIVALYRLTVPATPERNLPARYNICPTTTIDTVIERDAKREPVPMRWGLVPSWWKKKAKETPATFNARAETVAEKPMFQARPMPDPGVRLLRVAWHADRQAALLLHGAGWLVADNRRDMG
jgi:putative SOS response-associated peptidase YedK